MKKPVFIVAGEGRKLGTEAELFESLDVSEAFVLKKYPLIDDDIWRGMIQLSPEKGREQMAIEALIRLRALREALQNSDTPAWRVAILAIKFQDMVMIYRQPVTQTAAGRVYAGKKEARKPKDELAMRVMRYLRNQRKTWKETLDELEDAWRDGRQIARVDIEKINEHWIFTRHHGDAPDQVESFRVSTLQMKKFPKAR